MTSKVKTKQEERIAKAIINVVEATAYSVIGNNFDHKDIAKALMNAVAEIMQEVKRGPENKDGFFK